MVEVESELTCSSVDAGLGGYVVGEVGGQKNYLWDCGGRRARGNKSSCIRILIRKNKRGVDAEGIIFGGLWHEVG